LRILAVLFALAALCAVEALAQPDPLLVMPLGDSITQARGGSSVEQPGFAGYRYWLWKDLESAGYPVDFVGSNYGTWNGPPPYSDYDQDHEGHWGWRADQILVEIGDWAAAAHPDVVLIHLGTNDLWQGQSIESTISELGQIIDVMRGVNPETTFLLAQLISAYPASLDSIAPFNDEIPVLAAAKHTETSPVLVVDMFTGFDPWQHTYDGVHPNEPGEQFMAERWLVPLEAIFESVSSVTDPVPEATEKLQVAGFPNPFNPTTRISYYVPTAGTVRVSIHSLTGRTVATLRSGHMEAGEHTATWNGRDATGGDVASGVYFVRVSYGQESVTSKIALVR